MPVRVTLEGEGLNYSADTDIFKASHIIAFLNAPASPLGGQSPASSQTNMITKVALSASGKSPREMLNEYQAKTNPQKIATLALYLKNTGRDTFTPIDIKSLFTRIGEPMPGNFTRDFADAKTQTLIFETENPGEFCLTDHGIDQVFSSFKDKTPNASRKKTAGKRVNSGVRQEVEELPIQGSMDGCMDFHSLETKAMKILWILKMAETHGVSDGLSGGEVEFIARKLKEEILNKDFSALNGANVKKSFVSQNKEGRWEILKRGEDMLVTNHESVSA